MLLRAFLIGLCSIFSGCGTLFTPNIDDLKFVSASVINLIDHPEITWLGVKRPSLDVLEIIFESQTNILNAARELELNITENIFFCKDGANKYTGGINQIGGVYGFGLKGEITAYINESENLLKPKGKSLYEYKIYAGPPDSFNSYGVEQQASIVQNYYILSNTNSASSVYNPAVISLYQNTLGTAGLAASSAADGGFVLYQNKSNTNQMISVYKK